MGILVGNLKNNINHSLQKDKAHITLDLCRFQFFAYKSILYNNALIKKGLHLFADITKICEFKFSGF